jgi:hypothetical protein
MGAAPYSWLEPYQIIEYLTSGQRLAKPKDADQQMFVSSRIYRKHINPHRFTLMQSCWVDNVDERPKFTNLRTALRNRLERATDMYGYVEYSAVEVENNKKSKTHTLESVEMD